MRVRPVEATDIARNTTRKNGIGDIQKKEVTSGRQQNTRQLLRASSNNTKAQMPLMNTAGIKRGIKRSVIIIGAEAEVGPRRETTTNTARVRRSPNIVKTQKRGRAEVQKKSKNME